MGQSTTMVRMSRITQTETALELTFAHACSDEQLLAVLRSEHIV